MTTRDRVARERRTLRLALGASVVFHAVLVTRSVEVAVRPVASGGGVAGVPVEPTAGGVRLVTIVDLEEPSTGADAVRPSSSERPAVPEPATSSDPTRDQPAVEERVAPPVGPTGSAAPGAPERERPTRPPRLAPALLDGRLWTRSRPRSDPADWSRERQVIRYRIAEENRSRASTPTEVTGMSRWVGEGAGGQWGVSPGRIHLGGHAIRICGGADASECGFGLLPNQRASYRDWATRWREIRGQGRALELRESWRERARGIRVRRDAERADTTRADYS